MRILFTRTALLIASMAAGFAAQVEGSFDRTLSVSGPVDIDAITDAGGIVVTGSSSGNVHIHGTLKSSRGGWDWFDSQDVSQKIRQLEQNPPIEQSGNSIRV